MGVVGVVVVGVVVGGVVVVVVVWGGGGGECGGYGSGCGSNGVMYLCLDHEHSSPPHILDHLKDTDGCL